MIAVRSPHGRWLGALVAVPLAAGGPNSACEADYPPPDAQAPGQTGDQAPEQAGKPGKQGGNPGGPSLSRERKKPERKKPDERGKAGGRDRHREPSRDVVCVVSADVPAVHQDGRLIAGRAAYWCESPGADRLTVVVRVERRHHDGTWVAVASSRDTVTGRQTIRVESRQEPAGWATASCRPGTFRTVVVAKRKTAGDVEVVVDHSFHATDPCAGP